MNKLIVLILAGISFSLLSGCGSWEGDAILSTGEPACWNIEEVLEASVEVAGLSVRPEVFIHFNQDYPFMNLQMTMSWESPSGQTGSYDFQTTVVDPSGDWLAERVSGSYPVRIALKDPIEIDQEGVWTFRLSHNMREDQICEIQTVGFVVNGE